MIEVVNVQTVKPDFYKIYVYVGRQEKWWPRALAHFKKTGVNLRNFSYLGKYFEKINKYKGETTTEKYTNWLHERLLDPLSD